MFFHCDCRDLRICQVALRVSLWSPLLTSAWWVGSTHLWPVDGIGSIHFLLFPWPICREEPLPIPAASYDAAGEIHMPVTFTSENHLVPVVGFPGGTFNVRDPAPPLFRVIGSP